MTRRRPARAIALVAIAALLVLSSACAPGRPNARRSIEDPWSGRYPAATIGNDHVSALVMLPDANNGFYRGRRFDHAGIIARVAGGGHTYYGPIVDPNEHEPSDHDDIAGICDEFGMDTALGYGEAQPGQPFVKIGVGVLRRKDDGKYRFNKAYEMVDPGRWDIRRSDDRITFTHTLNGPRGWGYVYTKTVRVVRDEPQIVIERTLTNTGAKPIDNLQYCHNFTFIDDQPFDGAYVVRFPFDAQRGEHFYARGVCAFVDGDLNFTDGLAEGSVWGLVSGYDPNDPADNAATVAHARTGAAVSYDVDRPLAKLVVYAQTPAICPEPFVTIRVEPGNKTTWRTAYEFTGR